MSVQVRQEIVSQLRFSSDPSQAEGQRDDLLTFDSNNPSHPAQGTSTQLIAFLQELLNARGGIWRGKLEVLAVRSDHPTQDGPNGHSGGNAIDFAPIVDDADGHLMNDINNCGDAEGIGLGGKYKVFGYTGKEFQDNDSDHIHVQVQTY